MPRERSDVEPVSNQEGGMKEDEITIELDAGAFAVDDDGDTLDIEFDLKPKHKYAHFKFYNFPREWVESIQEGKRYSVRIVITEQEGGLE
jgi:hypothetical protein